MDWYRCSHCDREIPGDKPHIQCGICSSIWCDMECAMFDGYTEGHCEYRIEDICSKECTGCTNYVREFCKYCK